MDFLFIFFFFPQKSCWIFFLFSNFAMHFGIWKIDIVEWEVLKCRFSVNNFTTKSEVVNFFQCGHLFSNSFNRIQHRKWSRVSSKRKTKIFNIKTGIVYWHPSKVAKGLTSSSCIDYPAMELFLKTISIIFVWGRGITKNSKSHLQSEDVTLWPPHLEAYERSLFHFFLEHSAKSFPHYGEKKWW